MISTGSSRRRSPRSSSRTTTSGSSTTAASGRGPTSRTAGVPREEWEDLLGEMRRRADAAGHLRYHLPEKFGGQDGSNLGMAIIREHLAAKGLGLFNDLQNESSVVGNFPTVLMMDRYGSAAQKEQWIPKMLAGEARIGFGLTEPLHGSDATWMETTADPRRRRVGHQRRQDVEQRAAPRHPRLHLRPHLRPARRGQGHHLLHRTDRRARRASRSRSSCGRSTCPPTTPG